MCVCVCKILYLKTSVLRNESSADRGWLKCHSPFACGVPAVPEGGDAEGSCPLAAFFKKMALLSFCWAVKRVAPFALKTDLATCRIPSVCPLLVFLCQSPRIAFKALSQHVLLWTLSLVWRLQSSCPGFGLLSFLTSHPGPSSAEPRLFLESSIYPGISLSH